MQDMIAPYSTVLALVVAGISLGGGLYETALIDPVWPANLKLVQPKQGGINRKLFWMPAHFTFEPLLLLSLWAAWHVPHARTALSVALVSHVAMRAWSFAYFIPRALAFEKVKHLTPELAIQMRRWSRLSKMRLPLDIITIAAIAVALFALIGRPGLG